MFWSKEKKKKNSEGNFLPLQFHYGALYFFLSILLLKLSHAIFFINVIDYHEDILCSYIWSCLLSLTWIFPIFLIYWSFFTEFELRFPCIFIFLGSKISFPKFDRSHAFASHSLTESNSWCFHQAAKPRQFHDCIVKLGMEDIYQPPACEGVTTVNRSKMKK